MNVLTTTWRQLVRRRLWPVALLLVAALAAVPVVLARDGEAPAPPADPVAAASAEADDTIAKPIVAKVSAEDRDRRRRVLGARKDPFRPAPVKAPKASTAGTGAQPGLADKTDTGSVPSSTGSDGGFGSGGTPIAGEQPAPKTYYEAGTIVVRFGEASESGQLARFAIGKLQPVPDDELPLLVYMGLTKDGKKAKFLVDAAVEVDGDGVCRPHRSSCETIELAVGETEFLDVVDPDYDEATMPEEQKYVGQFQLDLVDIKRAGDDDVK